MKTSLLRIGAVAALAAGTLGAQIHPSRLQDEPNRSLLFPERIQTEMLPSTSSSLFAPAKPALKDAPAPQAISWVNLWSTRYGPSFEVYTRSPILDYDAGTNSINLLRATGDGSNPGDGVIQVVTSTDGGANWAATEVFRRTGYLFLLPGFAISNPGVTSLADAYWTVFGFAYEWDGQSYPYQGGVGLFKTADDLFDFDMASGPDLNNAAGYGWDLGDLLGVDGDAPAIHHVSRLNSPTNIQYGAYGQWGFDPSFGDFTASSIPTQWDLNQFANPNNIEQTLNSSPSLDADTEGRLYMLVCNLFADDDQNRIPAVSKSEDQGATWTSFERMPVNVLDAYRTQYGWANCTVYGPYNREALVVTGVNKFSYFFRVAQRDAANNNNVMNLDLVEARYDNGVWTLTRVAELNGFPVEFARATEPSDQIGPNAWLPSYAGTRFGHEIHVAKTADGQSLLLQWIDDAPERGWKTFEPAITVYFNNQGNWVDFQLDSILTTDIYYSYRSISGGTWTEKTNITNDDAYDHGTRLPRVIPNLTNVPLIGLRPAPFSQYNPQYGRLPALQALPALVYDATVDNGTISSVQFGTYNAANPNSVQNDVPAYAFDLKTIAPNPAQTEAEVTFTMDAPGLVTLELFSSTGARVASIYNGQLDAGLHGITVDASTYANGTYYVALSVNGQRMTQPISIVR